MPTMNDAPRSKMPHVCEGNDRQRNQCARAARCLSSARSVVTRATASTAQYRASESNVAPISIEITPDSRWFNPAEALSQIGLAKARAGSGITCISMHSVGAASDTIRAGGSSRVNGTRLAAAGEIAMNISATARTADIDPNSNYYRATR